MTQTTSILAPMNYNELKSNTSWKAILQDASRHSYELSCHDITASTTDTYRKYLHLYSNASGVVATISDSGARPKGLPIKILAPLCFFPLSAFLLGEIGAIARHVMPIKGSVKNQRRSNGTSAATKRCFLFDYSSGRYSLSSTTTTTTTTPTTTTP